MNSGTDNGYGLIALKGHSLSMLDISQNVLPKLKKTVN